MTNPATGELGGDLEQPTERSAFTLAKFGPGEEIGAGDNVTLRTYDGAHFVMATNGGGSTVHAKSTNRETIPCPPGHVSLARAASVKLASVRESERRLFGARQVPAGRPPDGMNPGPTRLPADGTAYEASRPDGTAPTPGDSEAVRRQAFDAAPDAVFAIDREYRLLFNNRNHQSMLAARGVGPLRTGDSVLSPAYPPEVLAFWRAAYDRALQGERFTLDIDETNPEGVQQWYANILSPLGDAQGAVIGVLVVVHDVSDRKRAEELFRANTERFRVALAAAPVVVFNQDRELRYTWVGNPALGMKAADAIGRTDEELLGAEMARPLTTIKRRVLDTGRFARTSC